MTHSKTQIDASLQTQLHELMAELYDLVSRLQLPRLKGSAWREQVLTRCRELCARISVMLEQLGDMGLGAEVFLGERIHRLRDHYSKSWEEHRAALHHDLEKVAEQLRVYSAALSDRAHRHTLEDLYETLSAGYEDLVEEIVDLRRVGLISTAQARHLKPVNFARNAYHVAMGLMGVLLYQFVLSREQALVILASILSVFGVLEISRRFSTRWNDFLVDKVFGWVSRPHERTQTNGSTWYVIALVLIVFLYPKPIVMTAVLTLALADPAASLAGKLWGKKKILAGKTYLGSLVFLVVAFAVCLPFALSAQSLLFALPVAVAVALSATLAELFITKIDDNFTIPMVSAAMAWLLF